MARFGIGEVNPRERPAQRHGFPRVAISATFKPRKPFANVWDIDHGDWSD